MTDLPAHMSTWWCLNCNFFFQMRTGMVKGDHNLRSCTKPESSIDFFRIIHQSLGQLKNKSSVSHLMFRLSDILKGDFCLLFCFAWNETIMEAFPKVLQCLMGCCLCIHFYVEAKLSPPELSQRGIFAGNYYSNTQALLG